MKRLNMGNPEQNNKSKQTFVPLIPTQLINYFSKFYEKLHVSDVLYSNKVFTYVQKYTPLRTLSKVIGFISDGPALPLFLLLYWYAELPSPLYFALYTIGWMTFHEFIIKGFFHRKRPLSAGNKKGLSFPSSHSFASGYILALCSFLPFPYKPFLIAFALINAVNRPALGVHYIADVVAGLTIGLFIGAGWLLFI